VTNRWCSWNSWRNLREWASLPGLRLFVLVGLWAITVLLAPRASRTMFLLLIGAGLLVAFWRWPLLGLIALMVGSLVIPFEISTGTQSMLNITVLLLPMLIGLWVVNLVSQKGQRLLMARPLWPLSAFVVVAVLAFIAGNQPWLIFAQTAPIQAQLGGLAVFVLSAGAFILAAYQVREIRELKWLTWLFLSLGAFYIASRLIPDLRRLSGLSFQRGASDSLFWVWLISLAFSQAIFHHDLHPAWRVGLLGLVLCTFYVALSQGRVWVSGWLPSSVAVMVTLWVGARPLRWPLLLGLGVMAILNQSKLMSLVLSDNEYSLVTRLEAWRIVVEIVRANPVLGLGPANYYWYTPLFPILGYAVNFNSHNNYVDILAQTGLLGLACFLWFVLEVGRWGWQLQLRRLSSFARAYVYGALGGLAGMLTAAMLGDWVLPFVYNVGLKGLRASVIGWFFLGGLIAVGNRMSEKGTHND
jgi:hypothetical protein